MRSDTFRSLAAVAFLAAIAPMVGAQAHFAPPSNHADYTRYTIPQECVSAVTRVTDSVRWQVRRDTLPYDASEPLPAAAVETAHRCLAPFAVAKVDTNSLRALRDLALAANEDSLAARAVARELANAGQSIAARAQILVSAEQANLDAHPVRLEAARRYVAQVDALGPHASKARLEARSRLSQVLVAEMKDIDGILKLTNEMQDVIQHVPPELRAADPQSWHDAENIMRAALIAISELRDGPAAGLAERKARGWDTGTVLGLRAPPIVASYWFNRPNEDARPPAGKLSLVVFADPSCGVRCFPYYATLRRLTRAHPEVEVTLVAQTHGYFGRRLTTKAAEEAEIERKYLLDFHHLPGTLAVDSTTFVRIATPDNRRFDDHARNNAGYGFRQGGVKYPGTFLDYFLVGPDGIIDFDGTVMPQQERLIEAEIAAIERTTAAPAARP